MGDESITYELAVDGKGRARAKAVTFVGDRTRPVGGRGRSSFPPFFAVCFLISVGAVVLIGRLPLAVLVLCLVASVLTFFVYASDKSAAMRQEWRTAESTLHLFALAGGWPGAVAAQRFLRHKSAKGSFQIAFWITVVLNCVAIAWLTSPVGTELLHSVLSRLSQVIQ